MSYLDSTSYYYPTPALLSQSQEDLLLNGDIHQQHYFPQPSQLQPQLQLPQQQQQQQQQSLHRSAVAPYISIPPHLQQMPATPTSHSYPTYDPNSPFNSPIVPVKNMGKDGRLKTMLKGIGIDGGFLTSPLTFGRSKHAQPSMPPPTPIAVVAPPNDPRYQHHLSPQHQNQHLPRQQQQQIQQQHQQRKLLVGSEEAYLMAYQQHPDLRNVAYLDQQHAQLQQQHLQQQHQLQQQQQQHQANSYASTSMLGQGGGTGPGGTLPGARRQRTVSAALPPSSLDSYAAREPDRPVTPSNLTSRPLQPSYSTTKFESQYSPAPPLPPLPPPSAKPGKKLRKASSAWSLKSLGKAKSCPSLSDSAAAADSKRPTTPSSTRNTTYRPPMEPLTPVSATGNFPLVPGVPFNSPVDAEATLVDAATMPFSFADLYNYGLAADSIADIDPRKSPYDFVNELIGSENEGGLSIMNAGTDLGELAAGDYLADLSEYGLIYGLPTPHLAPSGLSTPSTGFSSDNSPADQPNSPPRFVADSALLDGSSTLALPTPASSTATISRQRCISYSTARPQLIVEEPPATLDPSSLFKIEPVQLAAHLSTTSTLSNYAPTPTYAYPTSYVAPESIDVAQQQQHHLSPYSSHALAPPASIVETVNPYLPSFQPQPSGSYIAQGGSYPSHSGSFVAEDGMFETRGGLFGPQPSAPSYEAQLRGAVSLDSMFSQYASGSTSAAVPPMPATPKRKRGRETTDDEDGYSTLAELTDGDDYITGDELTAAVRPPIPTPKRQRVVSAPASVGRRLRPGPRPKSQSRSPQLQGESVFSLSPPPLPDRRSATPYLSDASPYLEISGPSEVHMVRSRDEIVALPKEVIQSMYNTVSAYVDGVKMPKRYECLIEGCGREFPRKSAIESHIQTHLEDKPFICLVDDCEASFVRQHDLRRHERIHSGNKPFPCPCGKGFARGDALHRHRQRGICCGSVVPRRP